MTGARVATDLGTAATGAAAHGPSDPLVEILSGRPPGAECRALRDR